MLTKEQATAAADALAHQRGMTSAPVAPPNPFLLPAFALLAGAASGVVGYLTGSRPAWLSALALVVVMVVLVSRNRRPK